MPLSQKKIIYILLCLGCITISFNVAAITAAIPAISVGLGQPDFLVSKVIPYYMIPYGIGALAYAPLTRKFSYRTILVAAFLIYTLAGVFCSLATSVEQLFVGRAVMGISGAAAIPLGLMLIGQLFDKEVRGRLVGLFFSTSFVASNIGLILGGITDWRWLFLVPAGLALLTAISIAFVRHPALSQRNTHRVNYIKALKISAIRNIFIFIFVVSALYHGVQQWYGVYLSRVYHLDKFGITLFFIVMSLTSIVGQMGGGWITDKKGRYLACLIGIIILASATVGLLFQYPLLILGFVLGSFSLGWTVGHNGASTVLTDFPDDHRAEIASLNSAVRFVSGGVGFSVSSLFVPYGFGLTFFVFGVAMFLCLIFLRKVIP